MTQHLLGTVLLFLNIGCQVTFVPPFRTAFVMWSNGFGIAFISMQYDRGFLTLGIMICLLLWIEIVTGK
jgi:hypothetical protein